MYTNSCFLDSFKMGLNMNDFNRDKKEDNLIKGRLNGSEITFENYKQANKIYKKLKKGELNATIEHDYTDAAALSFMSFFYKFFKQNPSEPFPTSGLNLCIGFASPQRDFGKVWVSISKGMNDNNESLKQRRRKVKNLLKSYNENRDVNKEPELILAREHSQNQAVLLRALGENIDSPAPSEKAKPRCRCAEIPLMAVINKTYASEKKENDGNVQLSTFDATLWKEQLTSKPSLKNEEVNGWISPKEIPRLTQNSKYLFEQGLAVKVDEFVIGYLFRWAPCENHCAPLMNAIHSVMLAGKKNGGGFASPIGYGSEEDTV